MCNMNRTEATKIVKNISKMLDCDCEVYDLNEETLYINTGEDTLDFEMLLGVHKLYNIEAINSDDDYEGYLILQIDLRTGEQKQFDQEVTEELLRG
jgi:hypothetical protein